MNILDELTYAKELLVGGFKKYASTNDLIILATYFRQNGTDDETALEKMLVSICKKHDPEFNEVLQSKKIDIAIRRSRNKMLRIPLDIPITKNEMESIKKLKNYRYEKILFIMLVLAKYYKLTNPNVKKSDSKIYYIQKIKPSLIFRLAHTSEKRGENILYDLGKLGLIDKSLRYGSYSICFSNMEDNSEIQIMITDINKIIDFYIPLCKDCGTQINKGKNNNREFCNLCWGRRRKIYNRNIKNEKLRNI